MTVEHIFIFELSKNYVACGTVCSLTFCLEPMGMGPGTESFDRI
jgi:hypothetical protein